MSFISIGRHLCTLLRIHNSSVNILSEVMKCTGPSVSSARCCSSASQGWDSSRHRLILSHGAPRNQESFQLGQKFPTQLLSSWTADCRQYQLASCDQQLQVLQQFQQRRFYSTPPSSGSTGPSQADTGAAESGEVQLTQREKLKRAVKEYGSTVLVFHITISLASLGGFYLAVSSGIDMVSILKNMGVGEAILQSKLATGTGTFVVAYAVHKVFAPVRIGITLTATPLIVRYLRSKGVLKPPKRPS